MGGAGRAGGDCARLVHKGSYPPRAVKVPPPDGGSRVNHGSASCSARGWSGCSGTGQERVWNGSGTGQGRPSQALVSAGRQHWATMRHPRSAIHGDSHKAGTVGASIGGRKIRCDWVGAPDAHLDSPPSRVCCRGRVAIERQSQFLSGLGSERWAHDEASPGTSSEQTVQRIGIGTGAK